MAAFQAILLRKERESVTARVESLDEAGLPPAEVRVRVDYSSLNYKDGLIVKGMAGLVRTYPHVPGIDYAGTVERSDDPALKPGDRVILTGWRVGEVSWGGYAQLAQAKAGQLVKLPDGLSTLQAMAIGTAGLTAMLALLVLERHGLAPGSGDVLVTGAAGGVGSIAVALLARLGHSVHASTGRPYETDYLRRLGAAQIVARESLSQGPSRPLESERWAGAIDSVGGKTLATVLAQLRYRASVAACGLAGGRDVETSVAPFILRGINLLGIDSVMCPLDERTQAWRRLASDLPLDLLDEMTKVVPLSAVPGLANDILAGKVRGRVVVDVNA